ncbi:hypothetical protein FRC11_010557, partial [Ceratobasidium sp. 423]
MNYGRMSELKALSDINKLGASPANVSRTAANTRGRRGRQFASLDSSSFPTPIPPSWKMKEPSDVSSRKDWMPSLATAIKHLQEKTDTTGRERPRTCQAPLPPPANTNIASGRLKRVKIKAKRFTPYPGFANSNVRPRDRGLIPGTVETRGRKSPLATTLFGDPRFLQSDPIAWFILIVAVDYPDRDLQDPEHDLEFWKKMLDDPALESELIYLTELAGEQATPENIRKELAQLYHDSEELETLGRPNLFVYLTGQGDGQNRMHLLGGNFVSEGDIDQWLQEFRTIWGYTRPITLVLDICRTNKHKPSARIHHGVELICSSSPGEKALALRFKSEQDAPYSSFMLAFIVASSISPTSTGASFISVIEHRLEQFTQLIRLSASSKDPKATNDFGPQRPDCSQVRDLSTFLDLARMLSRTTVARQVHDFVTQLPYFREE